MKISTEQIENALVQAMQREFEKDWSNDRLEINIELLEELGFSHKGEIYSFDITISGTWVHQRGFHADCYDLEITLNDNNGDSVEFTLEKSMEQIMIIVEEELL